jgi:hypothetical protein
MRLYSSQPLFVYEHLMRGETWVADPFAPGVAEEPIDEIDLNFQRAYGWLVDQMHAQGIKPNLAHAKFPIWAYYQWAGIDEPIPDLSSESLRGYADKGTQVLLTLDVDASRVLLSDYDAWHWVLNIWYMGSEEESEDFERRCEAAGVKYRSEWPLSDPDLHAEMIASWQGIFNQERSAIALQESPDRSTIQAVFWELRPEDVIAAVKFDVEGPTEDLPAPVS